MIADSLSILFHNITTLRSHYGYSKKHMAKLLGIGIETLNKIEKGIIPPRLGIDIVFTVCKQFHIRPSMLLSQKLYCKSVITPEIATGGKPPSQ